MAAFTATDLFGIVGSLCNDDGWTMALSLVCVQSLVGLSHGLLGGGHRVGEELHVARRVRLELAIQLLKRRLRIKAARSVTVYQPYKSFSYLQYKFKF